MGKRREIKQPKREREKRPFCLRFQHEFRRQQLSVLPYCDYLHLCRLQNNRLAQTTYTLATDKGQRWSTRSPYGF